MPYGDRTGPLGSGPRTGWGRGYCSGYPLSGYANRGYWAAGYAPGYYRGYGGRRYGPYPRYGRGWRRW